MKKTISKLLNLIATITIVVIIVVMLPLTLPKAFGLKLYGVLTESMTPTYKVGGVVYVKPCEAKDVATNDVITYSTGRSDEVITHRVIEVKENSFITKGDNNNTTDPSPILKTQLVGRVVFYLPFVANVADFVSDVNGLIFMAVIFIICIAMWIISDILIKDKKSGEMKKQNKGSALIFAGALLIVGALVYLGIGLLSYKRAEEIYDKINEEILDNIEEENTKITDENGLTKRDKTILDRINLLHETYPNLIGFILIPGTKISYPIMQGDDDEYYLSHAYNDEVSTSGSIFLTADSNIEFSEIYQILYGHNMRNGTMFGGLHKYEQEDDYLKEHPQVYIYTLDTLIKYDIFSYYNVNANDDIYNIYYQNMGDFQPVFESMLNRSMTDTDINPEYTQGIITLSTCNGDSSKRFVIHAARVWE